MTVPTLGTPAAMGATGALRRLDAFERIAPLAGRKLLDVGCGNGLYTLRMAERFDTVVGIDLVPEHLDEFRNAVPPSLHGRVEILEQSLTAMPWDDETFDVVTAIEVLEHVDDVEHGLSEIYRVMMPGGRLFVAVPNRLFPLETHAVIIGGKYMPGRRIPFLPWIPPLQRRWSEVGNFTARSVTDLLSRAGFVVSRPEYIMPPFDHWQAGQRYIKPLSDAAERSSLRRFGVSVLVCAVKPT